MESYVNKIAVVTGSSSGIGAGIAKELTKRGCIVIGLARRLDRLQLLSKEINQSRNASTGRFYPLQCDVSDLQQLDNAFTKIEKTYGIPTILVNNAAIAQMKKLEELDSQIFDATIQTNVKAMIFAIKRVMEMMIKYSIAGHIININSIASHYMPPKENFLLYSASKIMTRFVTDMMREKVAKKKLNIKVSSISPGVVRTELFRAEVYEQMMEVLPVDEIVNAINFILDTSPNVLISELIIMPVHQCTTIMYPNKESTTLTHQRKAKL